MTETNVMGIYKIENNITNKFYIGSSINIKSRYNHHLGDLNKNNHHCRYLQYAWNKYGSDKFELKIIELINDVEKLLNREQYYLDLYKYSKILYNVCRYAGNCLGVKQSKETKIKRAMKLIGRKRTPEQCKNISIAKKKHGISKEVQKMLNEFSYQRRFAITKEQAYQACLIHKDGETWSNIAKTFNISVKIFRRQLDKLVNDKSLLSPIRRGNTQLRGDKHPNARLKESNIIYIRNSPKSSAELANEFNVVQTHICDIRARRTWRHI